MIDVVEARALALALPETTEQDHHGMASFRVRGKIFATLPDDAHMRVMVDEAETHAAVARYPAVCDEFYWGRRLACVVVTLASASTSVLQELLTEAWLRKAPDAVAREVRPLP